MQQATRHLSHAGGLSVRTARIVGWAGLVAAVALPAAVWRHPLQIVATDFRWDADYLLMGWLGYALMATAVLIMLPVVLSIGRSPESRLYPRSRNALLAWSVSLYVLGAGIAAQVAQIATGLSGA
jgi:hypothetical protein